MRLRTALLGAVLAALLASPASAAIRVAGDPGGQIGPYLEKLRTMRNSGEKIVIDGLCLSACTMILGVIPRDRICVTQNARLGFHAAWRPDDSGRPVTSQSGTRLLMDVYPQHVRNWIAKRGGLTPRMKFLTGRELAAMYPTCGSADLRSVSNPPATAVSNTPATAVSASPNSDAPRARTRPSSR